MSTPRGADLGARVRRLCAPLSESQLRIVFAAIDVLTCIKKWSTRPTAGDRDRGIVYAFFAGGIQVQLIFMGIFRNFLHPKPGANTMDFCRQYQVKLDPKLAPNLPNLHPLYI